MRRIALGIVLLFLAALGLAWFAGTGGFGSHEAPGTPNPVARSAADVDATDAAVGRAAAAVGVARPKQILFGDLHVHTTFSTDAFMLSLPAAVGEGAHPPADACDFARHCSALDFWSMNDHAESITPRHWQETVEAVRQCNEVAGHADDPDTVAYLGWEWTNVGSTVDDHWGHKNVILRGGEGQAVPTRPIAAPGRARQAMQVGPGPIGLGVFALTSGQERIHELTRYLDERRGLAECPRDVPVRELPTDCQEYAYDPSELFAKLDDWNVDSLVIPHGTTWGFYTPAGATWDKQLVGSMHDSQRQRLFEIYSGHGNSEVFRPWSAVEFNADGEAICPQPTNGYLPTCWRAGEIIRERCAAAGGDATECEERAVTARAHAAAAGVAAHLTVPGEAASDWLDAGQCRDCSQPSFNYRPGSSGQYVLALGNFDDEGDPKHFRMGFLASSDNHFARPGTGYKEIHRTGMAEASASNRPREGMVAKLLEPPHEEPAAQSKDFDLVNTKLRGFQLVELERQTSFFSTGGLTAVHANGRNRDAIWDALERREVYGTSGPRMLLWFDLLNPPGSRGATLPMGSEIEMGRNPIFQVRAVGSFEQKPGCPEDSVAALGEERVQQVCKGECYFPGDRRRPITRIDIVRVRPQQRPGEDVSGLVEDPWRSFACDADPAGCVLTFEDPEYGASARDAVYYARAFEPEKPTINGDNLRCERDESGACVAVELCLDPDDDCLAPVAPRAWSSPIWLDQPVVGRARRAGGAAGPG